MIRKIFVALAALWLSMASFAQTKVNITGVIKGTDGLPVAGAVVMTDMQDAAVADADGKYMIKADMSKVKTLTVSCLGYKTISVSVGK